MWRKVLAPVLAGLAIAATIAGVFLNWYGGRHGWHFKWPQLFGGQGITGSDANLLTGMFFPFLIAGLIALAAILLRSASLMTVAGLLVLGFTILWMARQYQTAHSLTVGPGGMSWPVLGPLLGGIGLLAAAMMYAAARHVEHMRAAHRGEGEVRHGPWSRMRRRGEGEGEQGREAA
ncbi:hypothetical protein [Streptomyces sp. PT12]|uniref:hypothetical protein n=1 Tax=Streptomyces sp. PT12 TaxID=1510197 RepID=UPI0011BD7401|nr:hypothetical protein [Streptomyces sp. PT12]